MLKYCFCGCVFVLVFLCLDAKLGIENNKSARYCHSDDDNPYLYFGTKTSYDLIRENAGSATRCRAVQIWMFIRHGTRQPDIDNIEDMKLAIKLREGIIKEYESSKTPYENALCENDLQAIKDWSWDKTMEEEPLHLTAQGRKELSEIAKRYQMRYPELFGNYSSEDFYFRHSPKQRTQHSCYAFIDGLFGHDAYKTVQIEKPLNHDPITRGYRMCPVWIKDVDNNEDQRKAQLRIFRQSSEYKKMIMDISRRLGLKEESINQSQIIGLYDNCRFDKTKYPDVVSPWCAVFSKTDLILLEYYSDIGRYYKASYGYNLNAKLGCLPLQHLFNSFEKTVEEGVARPKTIAFFSHDTVLDMMFTTLNFSRDQQPLKGKDFHDLMANRKYRTSINTPFAANLVAVLHDCGQEQDERYQVQFLLNERPMHLDGCDHGLCSWSYLKKNLAFTKQCNLDFCQN